MIVVDVGGLYEIQIAMFINGAMSISRPPSELAKRNSLQAQAQATSQQQDPFSSGQ